MSTCMKMKGLVHTNVLECRLFSAFVLLEHFSAEVQGIMHMVMGEEREASVSKCWVHLSLDLCIHTVLLSNTYF